MHGKRAIKNEVEIGGYLFHFEFTPIGQMPSLFRRMEKRKHYQATMWRDGWGHRYTFPYTQEIGASKPDARKILAHLVEGALIGSLPFEIFLEDNEELRASDADARSYWEVHEIVWNHFLAMGVDDEDLEIILEDLEDETSEPLPVP